MKPRLTDVFRPPYDLRVVWALLPFGLVAAGFAVLPLRSWDYWWHVAFGRVVSHTHAMPLHNHFLYTMDAEAGSYVQAWLSQWALYDLHRATGLHGVLILRNFLAGTAFAALGWMAARRAGSVAVGSIAAMLAVPLGFFTIAARTHLLAWPLYLVVLPLAYAIRERRVGRRALFVFPMVTVLWVNLHGTFLVPTLVCLAFAGAGIGDRLLSRRWPDRENAGGQTSDITGWLAATAGSFGATFINPRGGEVYLYLVDLPTNPENLATVTEWFPATPWFPPFYGTYFWILLVGTLGLMAWRRGRLDLADLFVLVGFSLLAIRHSRALMWVGLSFPLVVTPYLRELGRHFSAEDDADSVLRQAGYVVAAVLLVAGPLLIQPWSGRNQLAIDLQPTPTRTEPPLAGLVTAGTPVEAGEALRELEEVPRIFHDHRYPGFLLFWLQNQTPEQMVFLDNRVELPPAEIWRTYDRVSRGEGHHEVFRTYGVDAVVASNEMQSGLIDALRADAAFELVIETPFYAFFLRRKGGNDG